MKKRIIYKAMLLACMGYMFATLVTPKMALATATAITTKTALEERFGTSYERSETYKDAIAIIKQDLSTDSTKTFLKEQGITTFSDVPKNAWYSQYIAIAVDRKLVSGYTDGTFKGGNPITRAEFATVLAKHNTTNAKIETNKLKTDYKGVIDYVGNSWYSPYWYHVKDYMPPIQSTSTELANSAITRGEVIYAIAKLYFPSEIASTGTYGKQIKNKTAKMVFNDISKIDYTTSRSLDVYLKAVGGSKGCPADIYSAILCLNAKGIINGDDKNNVKWDSPITRAETLVVFQNICTYLAK